MTEQQALPAGFWFAAATLPRKEHVAIENLELQNFRAFYPQEIVRKRHARKTIETMAPVFRGYVFIHMNPAEVRWRSINGTRGVHHVVSDGQGPLPIRPGVVESLIESTDEKGILRFVDPLVPGTMVRLRSGPMADQLGLIENLDGPNRVRLLLSFLGGQIRATVSRDSVIKIA